MLRSTRVAGALLPMLVTLALPALALADTVPGPGDQTPVPAGPATSFVNLYLAALSAIVPLAGYLINHYGPQRSEQVKGIAMGALAAGVAVLYQAVTPGDLGFNDETLLAVATTMVGSVLAHLGYAAAGINRALGAGTNRDGTPSTDRRLVSGDH